MMRELRAPRRIGRFAREERGVVTVHNLLFIIIICAIGAVALDVTHFYAARSQLQVSADLAAHSALYTSRYGRYDPDTGIYHPISSEGAAGAENAAINAVRFGMPQNGFGPVLTGADIVLGSLDYATGKVIPWQQVPRPNPTEPIVFDPKYIDSAAVAPHRVGDSAVGSFLFRIVGVDSMDVRTAAIFSLGHGECDPTQGFFSQQEVEMNGNNNFYPGFCIGAPAVWARNGNMFRPGVSVVTPTSADLQLSNSDVDTHNPGLTNAHQYGPVVYDPVNDYMNSELDLVRSNVAGLPGTPVHFTDHAYAYDLLTKPGWTQVVTDRLAAPIPLTGGMTYYPSTSSIYDPAMPNRLASNAIYVIDCTGGGPSGNITLRDDSTETEEDEDGTETTLRTFRNMVILTDCQVTFDGNAKLEDFVLSTTNSSSMGQWSIHTASGLTVGKDDDCDPAGGAALIMHGGFNAAAQTNFYGALLRVLKEVNFQSNAVGEGVSIISAGKKLDTNSNISMAVCGPAAGATSRDVSLRLRY